MHRMIDTATWDDPWFADLDPDAKLMFLYLLTNRRSTAAGAFEITLRHMAFETGLEPARIDAALDALGDRVVWWPEYRVIWIRNFYRHQAANENFAKSAQKFIADLPVPVQQAIAEQYPELVAEAYHPTDNPSGTPSEPMPTGTDTPDESVPNPSPSNRVGESSSRGGGDARDADASAPKPKSKPKPKAKRATSVPADFTLTDGRMAYAVDQGMDEDRARYQFERMLNWADAHAITRKDWDAQWRNWVLKDIRDNGKSASPDRPTRWKLNASGVMVEVPA